MYLTHALRAIYRAAVAATDPFFKYVSLLLSGNGANNSQNNTFVDSSTNNFTITRNGTSTQGSFSPYGSNWSNYFDGTGDYLSYPQSVPTQFGSGDFTVEFWVYRNSTSDGTVYGGRSPTANSNDGMVFGFRSNYFFMLISTGSGWNINTYSGLTGTTIPVGAWVHIAVTRTGTTLNVFTNGVLNYTATLSGSIVQTASVARIGSDPTGDVPVLSGYLSNFRLVKGTAVYTSAFTPSTTPLTPIANTSLLTCQSNRFIDNSTNNYAITVTGDTNIQRFSPFNPSSLTPTSYSGYFDGTGDYLTAPSNAAFAVGAIFTMECWFYPASHAGSLMMGSYGGGAAPQIGWQNSTTFGLASVQVAWRLTSGTLPTLNSWNHVAVVRSGTGTNQTSLFLNGVRIANGTVTDAFTTTTGFSIGGASNGSTTFTGYISNSRLVKGTAVYDPSLSTITVPTTPLTAIANTSLLTCQSTTFIDNSTNNFTITAAGDAKPTQQNPFGFTSVTTSGYTPSTIGGSGRFANTTNTTANVSATLTGASAMTTWTIEMFCYAETSSIVDQVLLGPWTPNLIRVSSGVLQVYLASGNFFSVSGALPTNQWNHLALCCDSTNLRLYVNGVRIAATANPNLSINMTDVVLGAQSTSSTSNDRWPGYISNFRVLNGTALYTGTTYTVPTAPLTAIANTKLLLGMTNAGIYDSAMMVNLETVGDAKISTAVSKFGGSSMAFDGVGDYLSIPDNPNLNLGSSDFTIEAWVYLRSMVSSSAIVSKGTNGQFLIFIGSNSELSFYASTSGSGWTITDLRIATAPSLNTWHHIAVTRSGSTVKTFFNGVTANSTTLTGSLVSQTTPVLVGYYTASFDGNINDLRITKGYARYTANFTPPTTAFPTA